jgi:hypothetical protein
MSVQQAVARRAAPVSPGSGQHAGGDPEARIVPILVLNPRADREFVAFAEAALGDGAIPLDAFEARLRKRYPRAVVHRRELSSEHSVIWYCYRDGRWTPGP